MNRLRWAVVPLVLIGMIVLAGGALGRIYANQLLLYLVAGSAVLSVAVGTLLRNRSAAFLPPLTVLLLFGYTVLCVKLTSGRSTVSGSLGDIYLDAVRNSVPRLLTSMIPVEAQPDTVLVPVVAGWAVGLMATELAVRYRRVLLGYLPPTILYGCSLYLVGPNAAGSAWYALAYAALAGLGLAVSAVEPVPKNQFTQNAATMRLRAVTTGAAGLVVLIAAVAVLGPVAGGAVSTQPSDPRQYVIPPQLDDIDANPLVRIAGWAQNPDQVLLNTNLSVDTRLRLAVLADYDGITWTVGATFRAAGRILAAPASTVGPTTEVTQEIGVAELEGRLVPAVADPVQVDGMRVAYDEVSGTLMNPDGLTPGESYTVVSDEPQLAVNKLSTASTPTGDAAARYLALPLQEAPQALRDISEHVEELGGGPYQQATALEQFLATHYAYNAKAASGHAFPNLEFFLATPPRGGGQQGTSEQFAATFAVIGRMLGLPTRVVVGFRAGAGASTVTGADALAWPEVLFEGIGWVAFNPMPQPDSSITPPEEELDPPEESEPPESSAPPQDYDDPSATPSGDPADSGDAAAPGSGDAGLPVAVIAGAGGLLLLLAVMVTILAARRSRTQRRLWKGTADERVRGAWRELHDALRLARRRAPAHLTASEVAGWAVDALGGKAAAPSLGAVVAAVNETTFAAPGMIAEQTADEAAHAVAAYTAVLRGVRSPVGRLLWTLTPRPLLWRDAPMPERGSAG